MPFDIQITDDAQRQLGSLAVREQRIVENAIMTKLVNEPIKTSRSLKQLRPNHLRNMSFAPATCASCTMWKERRLFS
jgi:hypothetical protein